MESKMNAELFTKELISEEEISQENNEKKKEEISYKDILKQKEYMKIVVAAVINRFGDAVDGVAFTWLVYILTQSAAWSAFIFGVNKLPSIFLQPFAGAIVEGKNKKRIMIFTDVIRAACVGVIIMMYLTGTLSKEVLVINTLVISSVEAFRGPAGTAILPKLLEKKYYDFGLSLQTGLCSVIDLIGLAIGGVIIAATGISGAMYIDLVTFLLSALIIMTLKVKENNLTKEKLNIKEHFHSMADGFSYVKRNKKMFYFLILAIFLNAMLVPVNCLEAPIVNEIFQRTEIMLSVIGVTLSLGMLLASFVYPYLKKIWKEKTILTIGSYGIAFLYIGFYLCGKMYKGTMLQAVVAVVITFISGMLISLMSSLINIEVVKNIDEKYLARIMALMAATAMAAMPIMSFIVTAVANIVSVENILLIVGCADMLGSFYLVTGYSESKKSKINS